MSKSLSVIATLLAALFVADCHAGCPDTIERARILTIDGFTCNFSGDGLWLKGAAMCGLYTLRPHDYTMALYIGATDHNGSGYESTGPVRHLFATHGTPRDYIIGRDVNLPIHRDLTALMNDPIHKAMIKYGLADPIDPNHNKAIFKAVMGGPDRCKVKYMYVSVPCTTDIKVGDTRQEPVSATRFDLVVFIRWSMDNRSTVPFHSQMEAVFREQPSGNVVGHIISDNVRGERMGGRWPAVLRNVRRDGPTITCTVNLIVSDDPVATDTATVYAAPGTGELRHDGGPPMYAEWYVSAEMVKRARAAGALSSGNGEIHFGKKYAGVK